MPPHTLPRVNDIAISESPPYMFSWWGFLLECFWNILHPETGLPLCHGWWSHTHISSNLCKSLVLSSLLTHSNLFLGIFPRKCRRCNTFTPPSPSSKDLNSPSKWSTSSRTCSKLIHYIQCSQCCTLYTVESKHRLGSHFAEHCALSTLFKLLVACHFNSCSHSHTYLTSATNLVNFCCTFCIGSKSSLRLENQNYPEVSHESHL